MAKMEATIGASKESLGRMELAKQAAKNLDESFSAASAAVKVMISEMNALGNCLKNLEIKMEIKGLHHGLDYHRQAKA
jgi:predicted Zn-dependent protease with MMP-like domain